MEEFLMARGRGRPTQEKPVEEVNEPVLTKEEQIKKLNQEIIAEHRADEEKKIEDIVCGACGKSLNLDPNKYLDMKGKQAKREQVECPSCEIINDIIIAYPNNGKPDVDDCTIEIILGGYKWQQSGIRIHDLTDKQIKAWYDNQMKAISDGSSRLPFEIQVLYRMMK
jgi:hypothetical protein